MTVQPPADYFRYCPGEEHIKLSNAVCRGRRRSNFPKCRGCQFNDDEMAQRHAVLLAGPVRQPAAPEAAPPPTPTPIESTPAPRAAAPQPVAPPAAARPQPPPDARTSAIDDLFRDADIRGVVPQPLSTSVAWRIGYAAAQFLRSRLKGLARADPGARSLVVGHDARTSSAAIHPAMTDGVRAAGVAVHDLGMIDTPQLYFAVRHIGAGGGIVTTGGRDRLAFSGFKLCGAGCASIATTTGLSDIRDIARRVPQHQTGASAARHETDVGESYRTWIWGLVGGAALARPIRVAIDSSGGVAERWAPAVFDGVSGLAVSLIDARQRRAAAASEKSDRRLAALGDAVLAADADLGVWFDADADACAFVDEHGAFIEPDIAHALIIQQILPRRGGGVVVCDEGCGPALVREIQRCGGVPRRERPGSHLIKKAMTEENAVLGVARSGQVFFRENANCESAFLTLAVMLNALATSASPMSELAAAAGVVS